MNRAVEEEISSIAIEAMLHEVAATPKPGLVDRLNSGAHCDMDIFTFFSSAAAIQPYFVKMAKIGSNFSGENLTELLKELRPIGIEAEKAMYIATKGVNTHKGLIFSLGILVSASAYLIKKNRSCKADEICHTASLMCNGIVERELDNLSTISTTGERLYKTEGLQGIRGEAESGFSSVLEISLPFLKKSSGNWNDRLINTLLQLMAKVEDSNIVGRHNKKTLKMIQNQTKEVMITGGASDDRGMEILKQMDLNFIEKKISPGGSADLLAVTIFLFNLEKNPDI